MPVQIAGDTTNAIEYAMLDSALARPLTLFAGKAVDQR